MAEKKPEVKGNQKKKEKSNNKTRKEIEDEEKQILTGLNLDEKVLKLLLGVEGPLFQPSESAMSRDQRNSVRLRTIAAGPFQLSDLQHPVIQGILQECEDSSLFGTKKVDDTVIFHGEFRFPDLEMALQRVEDIQQINKIFKAFVKPVLAEVQCNSYKEYYEQEFYGISKVQKGEQRSDRLLVAYNIPKTASNTKDLATLFPFCSDVFLSRDEDEQPTGLAYIEYTDSTTMRAALKELQETAPVIGDQQIIVHQYQPGTIPKENSGAGYDLLTALYKYIETKGSKLTQKQQQILEKRVRMLESKLSHTAKKLPWEKKLEEKKKQDAKKKKVPSLLDSQVVPVSRRTGLLGDSPMAGGRYPSGRPHFNNMGRGFHRGFMDDTMVGYGFPGRYGQASMGHQEYYNQNYGNQGYGYHNNDEETMENLIRGLSQVMENLKVSHQREQGTGKSGGGQGGGQGSGQGGGQGFGQQQHHSYMGGYGDSGAYNAAMNGQRGGRQRGGMGRGMTSAGRGYGQQEFWS